MQPLVRVILGSKTDILSGEKIREYLTMFNIPHDFYVSSAHRKPHETARLAAEAETKGIEVIIAAAGMAAHLPGVVASHTILPVIGVPLKGPNLAGEDALYSIVQMPTGVPVATVAIDGAKNAAILAAQILAIKHTEIKARLYEFKNSMAE